MSKDQLSHAELVRRTESYVRAEMAADSSGHDWWHAVRVRALACRIAAAEGADVELTEIAALLHDVADEKFSGSAEAGPAAARAFLAAEGCDPGMVEAVADIIAAMSFHGAGVAEAAMSLEGACVRDADRLDAIGAIGIARAFAYGGHAGRPIHDPEMAPVMAASKAAYRANKGASINHFAEKLLLLADRMSTVSGRQIAQGRHEFMVEFLARFQAEWAGEE
jgi:uncharacterized protein